MCRVRVMCFKPSEDGVRESPISEFSHILSTRQDFSDTNLAAFSGWMRPLQRLPEIG
jgi:hypothetical protein